MSLKVNGSKAGLDYLSGSNLGILYCLSEFRKVDLVQYSTRIVLKWPVYFDCRMDRI